MNELHHHNRDARHLIVRYADPELFVVAAEIAAEYASKIDKIGERHGVAIRHGNGRFWYVYKTPTAIIVHHHGFERTTP